MIESCRKCHELYEAVQVDAPAPPVCPRCAAIDELLESAAQLHDNIARRLDQGRMSGATLRRLVERTGRALEHARSTR